MAKRYEFKITRTQEFIVGIEAADQEEAKEIFDELIFDDFGDPVSSVSEIRWEWEDEDNAVEDEPPTWKRIDTKWIYNSTPPAVIEVKNGDEYWLSICWNHYTRVNNRYWTFSEATADAAWYLDNVKVKGE